MDPFEFVWNVESVFLLDKIPHIVTKCICPVIKKNVKYKEAFNKKKCDE